MQSTKILETAGWRQQYFRSWQGATDRTIIIITICRFMSFKMPWGLLLRYGIQTYYKSMHTAVIKPKNDKKSKRYIRQFEPHVI